MSSEEKSMTVTPISAEQKGKKRHHSKKRIRVRKRSSRKNSGRRLSFRERLMYYIIIVVGLALAILVTWLVMNAISNPNLINGIIKG